MAVEQQEVVMVVLYINFVYIDTESSNAVNKLWL